MSITIIDSSVPRVVLKIRFRRVKLLNYKETPDFMNIKGRRDLILIFYFYSQMYDANFILKSRNGSTNRLETKR